jgi:anti-sigma regulatory factor (Ser/Thr protein kinase)
MVIRLSATRCGARLARHLAVRQLRVWGLPYDGPVADSVAAVVAELAANAVTHGRVPGRDFELGLALGPETVRIAVSDTRTERRPPEPGEVVAPGTDAEGGRGLMLVQALAQAWGVAPRLPGKTVWAVIARTPDDAGAR